MKLKWLIALLLLNAAYVAALPSATIFYVANVLLHVILGFAGVVVLCWQWRRSPKIAVLVVAALLGGFLVVKGAVTDNRWALWAHVALGVVGLAMLLPRGRWRAGLASLAILAAALRFGWPIAWNGDRIRNPETVPVSMAEEGAGPKSPFWPSAANTNTGKIIPSDFFMDSALCGECHKDIYQQWQSSMHHFASFNNQFYRRSIEHMQELSGTQGSKWCAGCHDHAVFFNGRFDRPIKEQVNTPEAQNGLGCLSCHSIVHVNGSVGNGGFTIGYPPLHNLASSKNPWIKKANEFITYLNPEPHRRTFMKPFMREDSSEFCSTCHKVHLDVPVNNYRWFRGFNEYDNWQASGVSGQGARSFYYPPKPQQCADCHMPMERSQDAGNIHGFVHSHRFPAANTAVPTANEDNAQLKLTENFLKSGAVTVDIFAVSPAQAVLKSGAMSQSEMATTFAVGEEAETKIAPGAEGEVVPVTAPLNRVQPALRRGDTVRVDVVVRTKKVGHFFPGGTVDAYDTWLELKGTDDKGQTIFWSGMVEDDGHGPVEKGAHFYRSLQIDAHGNPINKRNAWATRAVVYVRLIPPGAADTVHYRMSIPENAGNKITLRARLCYRKFSWYETHESFAGQPDPSSPKSVTPDYDDRPTVFTASLNGVSAKEEKIPDLPIVVMAENEVTLPVVAHSARPLQPKTIALKDEWQRWNDYGIGLFLQGNLKAAAAAFQKVTEADPDNPDGWVNIGRCAVQEGDIERARVVLVKALAVAPNLARANYFYARVLRADGNYDGAAARLRIVLAQYPRDRVALNDLGRILFLQRKYADAVKTLESVLEIDPEDLQAHYNLMLCYNGLGNEKLAKEHEERYLRFKADESAQAITGPYRQAHPEDNNERQAVHEHVSVPLAELNAKRAAQVSVAAAGGSK